MIVCRIPIQNVTTADLTVHVEPWGQQHVLPQDGSLEIVFHGPAGGKPELLVGTSEVSIYAWEGCQAFVLKNNLCISQPTLMNTISRLSTSEGIDKSKLDLDPEIIGYAQHLLDAAEGWDKAGREAAFVVVAKMAALLHSQTNATFNWKLCQVILHSRGVFLHKSNSKHRDFSRMLAQGSGDVVPFLTEWYEASMLRDSLSEIAPSD